MTKKQALKLAERIVGELMTDGTGAKCSRLVLWDDNNKDLPDRGGLVASSAIRVVANVLENAK